MIFFLVQQNFDMINSNLENLKTKILREISPIHVKFDKLIDLLIKNQNMIIEKPQNNAINNEILFEEDIKQMKPLAIESDINNLEKNLCNQEFESAFVSSLYLKLYFKK